MHEQITFQKGLRFVGRFCGLHDAFQTDLGRFEKSVTNYENIGELCMFTYLYMCQVYTICILYVPLTCFS